jgi:hypothetical protein
MYTSQPVVGGRGFGTSLDKLGEAASAETHAQFATQSVTFSPDSESTLQVLAAVLGILALLLHFVASFQLESISDSEYILEAPMSSESGAIHRRFACMGCAARRGVPTFFNDYQSAATARESLLAQQPLQQVHARDQDCRRSAEHPSPARWRWRGRRRWSGWKLAPPTRAIPPRRCHDIGEYIMKSVISHGCDIRSY